MATSVGARLVETCESFCEELRRDVGLTLFRVELERRPSPLVVTLRTNAPPRVDPSGGPAVPADPASLERTLVADERVVGTLRIEDERRRAYPAEASETVERIIPSYARRLADLVERAQL